MADQFSMDDEADNVKLDKNDLYCKQCGTLVEPCAIKGKNDIYELWQRCPNANNEEKNHTQIRISSGEAHLIYQRIINPDSVNDVTDDNFTQQEIESIVNNTIFQRFSFPCKYCKKDTIQIRYQRQTANMKFYSICVQCKKVVDLASIYQYQQQNKK